LSGEHEILHSERPFTGVRVNLRRDRLRDPAGREYVREVVEHPGAAVVVPLLPDGRVVLVRQYRYAVDAWLLELPAGTLEAGEDPRECAARELTEETGYRAGKIVPLGSVYPSPGVLTEEMHFFAARGLSPGECDRDPGEQMEVRVLEPREVRRRIREGGIRDGKTIVGLHLALWGGA
jgi:ADP-ribose pyrophosphatase